MSSSHDEVWVYSVSVSPDMSRVATGGTDNIIKVWLYVGRFERFLTIWKIWNCFGGNEVQVFKGHGGWIRDILWLDDDRIVSASNDKFVKVPWVLEAAIRLW